MAIQGNEMSNNNNAQVFRLTPYQVGENDVVVAYTKETAIKILCEHSCCNKEFDFGEDDVEDLTYKLDVMLKDEEGGNICTLRDWLKESSKPRYLYGW